MRFLFDARTTGPIQATLGGKASEDIASKALARIDQRIRITNDERRSTIYNSRIAPWRTVICVTGSPELLSSLRIWSFK